MRAPDPTRTFYMLTGIVVLVAVLFSVTGCTTPPAPVTTEVRVPITVKCVTVMPAKPVYRTPTLPPNATGYDKVRALALDWVDSRKYESLLEIGLTACL